jgi:CheY-like chemotaxis protein
VDDKKENLYALEKVLEKVDADIVKATSGNDALMASLNHEFALAILDVQMPGMGGGELAKSLEGLRPEMKVLFMSGYTDNTIVHHGLLDKGIAFIQKPFTPDRLARKVREVLDK